MAYLHAQQDMATEHKTKLEDGQRAGKKVELLKNEKCSQKVNSHSFISHLLHLSFFFELIIFLPIH